MSHDDLPLASFGQGDYVVNWNPPKSHRQCVPVHEEFAHLLQGLIGKCAAVDGSASLVRQAAACKDHAETVRWLQHMGVKVDELQLHMQRVADYLKDGIPQGERGGDGHTDTP